MQCETLLHIDHNYDLILSLKIEKQVSTNMTRKCDNHTPLHINPQHHWEETQYTNSHIKAGKATSSLFLCEMITGLRVTLATSYQKKDQTQKSHRQCEQQ